MALIKVADIASGADTGDQGAAVAEHLEVALSRADAVTLSFDGVSTATSSFVNAALLPILDRMSFEEFKRRVRIVDSTRQINGMIRERVMHRAAALAAH